jgi:MoxR-like ATPases
MEERQVTVDGVTYVLEAPFMVVATQNPIEMEGTYPLPEAQRDRFMVRLAMGYPDVTAEMRMLDDHTGDDPLDSLKSVSTATEVRRLIAAVRSIHVSEPVRRYTVDLVTATRQSPEVRLGASPRSTLQLLRAAKAFAALDGRGYVLPDDIQLLSQPVLAHRLILTAEATIARRGPANVIAEAVRRVPVPRSSEQQAPPNQSPRRG